ncbi:hypothetical protein J4418_04965 [Candidatus Woesearchaeota archaeon]|nr:hypothetical protein [Candidatus Woesearchaeota archaeon]
MKRKISITVDDQILRQIDKISERKGINRSRYIEILLKKDFEDIPVLILTSKGKIGDLYKSLIEFNGKKLIDHQIKYLKRQDFFNINVATDSEPVKDYVKLNYKTVNVLFEEERLTSSGSIKRWGSQLGKEFLVMHGDVLAGVELKQLVAFHKENKSDMTLVLKTMNPFNKYGVAVLEGSTVKKFTEKPQNSDSHLCFTGISIFTRQALDKIDETEHYTTQLNKIDYKHGYIFEGFWKRFETEEDIKNSF